MGEKYNLRKFSFHPRESSLTHLINTNEDVRSFINLISAFVYRLSTLVLVQYYFDRQVFYSDTEFILYCLDFFHIFVLSDAMLHFIVICLFYPVARISYSSSEYQFLIATFFLIQSNQRYFVQLLFSLLSDS